jgi:hypothetical protein
MTVSRITLKTAQLPSLACAVAAGSLRAWRYDARRTKSVVARSVRKTARKNDASENHQTDYAPANRYA